MRRTLILAALAALTGGCVLADFSYEQTSKITGGAMMGMMKVAGVFSKQAREPMHSTILVKGDRMAHVNPFSTQVIDLQKETITEINFQKKTFSVVTFAEMAEALAQLQQKMKSEKGDNQANINVKGSVKETGQTKALSGANARQFIMTLEMEGTDQKTGKTGTVMVITSDMWIAPQAGYEEVRNFYQRMSQKLNWAPSSLGMFGQGDPRVSKGMADLYKEAAKIDGVPVLQVVKMGMGGDPNQPAPNGGQQPAAQQQQEQPAEKPSMGGALGRLGGGRLGGLGGFGRRRKQEEPAEQQPAAQSAPAQQAQPAGSPGSLMEMNIELTSFSNGPVDASKFDVPSGFKQVESETIKAMRR